MKCELKSASGDVTCNPHGDGLEKLLEWSSLISWKMWTCISLMNVYRVLCGEREEVGEDYSQVSCWNSTALN